QSQLQRAYQQLGDSLGKSLAIRPLVFGTIAIVPYGNTARSGVYRTITIVPYALPIVNCEL
ncbi:MAG: hypothetical protein LBS10_06900, partial [Gracilibacteraceae bacterium]|nr:hypothetical protein [Gracilibacteraceae bacterium]